MLSDEQIEEIGARLHRMPSYRYNADVAALLADRKVLVAQIERQHQKLIKLVEMQIDEMHSREKTELAELQAEVDRLKEVEENYRTLCEEKRKSDTSAIREIINDNKETGELRRERDRLRNENGLLKKELAKWDEKIEDYENCDICDLKAYEDCWQICASKDSMVAFILKQADCNDEVSYERGRLLAENAALKRAIKQYVACKTCINEADDGNCSKCMGSMHNKGYDGYELDFDRFKEGGGGE